jgi:hypothetical protein
MKIPTNSSDAPVSALLREARAERPLPPGFQPAVWRRIQAAEAPKPAPFLAWLDQLAESWLRPRYAIAAVAIVLLAGITTGMFDGRNDARARSRDRYLAAVAPHPVR